jgi:hypothetical protein
VGFYGRYGFETIDALEGQSNVRPRPRLLWLPMQVIKAAASPQH